MYVSREERNGLTKEYLNELFEYRDGKLYWKISTGRVKAGCEIITNNGKGYLIVGIRGHRYYVHRIIFYMHHGYLAVNIDHANTNSMDNSLENLRAATISQNIMNSKNHGSSSGFKSVCWDKSRNKWLAHISVAGKFLNLGRFDNVDDAVKAATSAREKYHGEFARHE